MVIIRALQAASSAEAELSARPGAAARTFWRASRLWPVGASGRCLPLKLLRAGRFLWLPVFFGLGVLAFFAAAEEPGAVAPALCFLAAGIGGFFARRAGHMRLSAVLVATCFFFAGFGAGVLRSLTASAPVLDRIRVAKVEATVETLDDRSGGARLLLRVRSIEGLPDEATPRKLRVTIRDRGDLQAGATIRATMRLIPPARPLEPGGYDFAREAWFMGIGAVGNIVSRVERIEAADPPVGLRLVAAIDRARNDLTRRIASVIGGDDGAVAAALVTGKRGMIRDEATEALRGAGIYHVVSISGLHMVLAAGLFLWSVRALLALFPAVALRFPIKKWAALFAMAGAVAYCVFAGSEVATERSLIMVLVMLGAILADRPALSMRNLAIAALIVLAREPESLLGPSFQMSFGAVAAMIAMFEKSEGDVVTAGDAPPGIVARLRKSVGIMLLTTFVAGLATGPFASFHFHRVNPYALIGNSLTLPLVEFIVMPSALVGVALGPFGLDAPVWTVMGWGIGGMMSVARFVASMEGSTRHVAAFGGGAVLLLGFALIWLTLWRSAIRFAAIPIAAAGLLLAARYDTPDIVIEPGARAMAVRGADGRMEALNGRGNNFAVSQWLLGDGDRRPPGDATLAGASRCDRMGCVTRLVDGRTVALVLDPDAFLEDCGRADILVTRLRAATACLGPELLLDGAHFAAHGATELRLGPTGDLAMRVASPAGLSRPWARSQAAPAAPIRVAPSARLEPAREDDEDDDDPTRFSAD